MKACQIIIVEFSDKTEIMTMPEEFTDRMICDSLEHDYPYDDDFLWVRPRYNGRDMDSEDLLNVLKHK